MRAVLCALLLALALGGCAQQEAEPLPPASLLPEEGVEKLEEKAPLLPERLALPYAPGQSLDPIGCPDGMQQTVASLICEGLFRLNRSFEPEPWLCASYAASEDGLSYTFTLRPGVTFSDGSPLTAGDVRATLDRARTSARYARRLSGIASVSAGEDGVTVRLRSPDGGLPALLDIPIVKDGTGEDGTPPVGTGPYFFDREEACLAANPSWWRGGGQCVDRIALVEAPDRDAMLYRFNSREVHLITADLTGVESISVSGDIQYRDAATTSLQFLYCNTAKAPLDNAALRRALWRGIDRDRVAEAFLSGHASAAQFPVAPSSPLYPAALEEPYDLEAFTAAVAEAGAAVETPLVLLVNEENGFKTSIARDLAGSFTAAGVPAEVRALPWEDYCAALSAGDFDLACAEVRLSANWDLTALLSTGGTLNYGGWADAQTDQLLAEYASAASRASAMEALCAYLKTQAPLLPVCFKSASILHQSDVLEGLEPTAAEPFYNLTECAVHLRRP